VSLHSGGFLVGFARQSVLVGTVRYFDNEGRLLNVTLQSRSKAKTGLVVAKDDYGYFRMRRVAHDKDRVLVTKDGKQVRREFIIYILSIKILTVTYKVMYFTTIKLTGII